MLFIAGGASGSIPDLDGTIRACLLNAASSKDAKGSLRVIDDAAKDCKTSETPIAFHSTSSLIDAATLDGDDPSDFFNLNDANEVVAGRPAFDGGATGITSPFTVDSESLVANLNADRLDGVSSSGFLSSDGGTIADLTVNGDLTVGNDAGDLTTINSDLDALGTNLRLGTGTASLLTIAASILGATPFRLEGATTNAFDTNIAVTDPTATRTFTIPDVTGTAITTGNLSSITALSGLLSGSPVTFEGATADANETTLAVTDPTADRTVTVPDATGTVLTSGNKDDMYSSISVSGSTLAVGSADLVFVISGTVTNLTGGNVGQAVTLFASGDNVSIADSVFPIRLSADWTPGAGDTLTLMRTGATTWSEISRSDN
jgi:hypothetical protein